MSKIDLKAMRAELEKRRTEITDDVRRMSEEIQSIGVEQDSEAGSVGNHFADDGSSVQESERLATMSGDMQEMLNQIDAALERIDDGTFGTCQRCGKQINPERIESFPYVAYCIECQTIIERQQALMAGR